jgi:hypothetical protein
MQRAAPFAERAFNACRIAAMKRAHANHAGLCAEFGYARRYLASLAETLSARILCY